MRGNADSHLTFFLLFEICLCCNLIPFVAEFVHAVVPTVPLVGVGQNTGREVPTLARQRAPNALPSPLARPTTVALLSVDVASERIPIQEAASALEVPMVDHPVAPHSVTVGGDEVPLDPTSRIRTVAARETILRDAAPAKDTTIAPVSAVLGEVAAPPNRPCETVVVQVGREVPPRPLETTRPEASDITEVPIPPLDLPRARREALATTEVGVVGARPVGVVDHTTTLLLPIQVDVLDGVGGSAIPKLREETVMAILTARVAVEEAREAMAILVGEATRVRRGLATATRAYPTATTEVNAPADDAVPLVGVVPPTRTVDTTVGSTT